MAACQGGITWWWWRILRSYTPGGLHSVLVLSMARPRSAARLVQILRPTVEMVIDPAACCANSGWRLARTSKCGCGTVRGVALLVLPERPAGSESLDEEALAALVTRDAMIGVAKNRIAAPRSPA